MAGRIDIDQILRIPLLPVLAAQALSVRRKAQALPEPPGPRQGRQGQGPRLRLLIAGDSSAAGVGADTQARALLGQLVTFLARDNTVEWRLEATTGHRTSDVIARLRNLDTRFDMAITALGVNDVTSGRTARQFADQQSHLLTLLTGTLGVQSVVVTGVPQMHRFPALPQPLAWVLGCQAARLDRELQRVCARFPQARHLPLHLPDDPALAASDGYHPGPKAYAIWARQAAGLLRQG